MDLNLDEMAPVANGLANVEMLPMVNQDPHARAAPDLVCPWHIGGSITSMGAPRVLVDLNMGSGWSRGVLRGFMAVAHERGWTVLHHHPPAQLDRLAVQFAPAASVIGPDTDRRSIGLIPRRSIVSVGLDLSSDGIPSVCPDEEAIASLALEHLLATGLRQVTTFRLDGAQHAVARERAFVEGAEQAGASVAVGWGSRDAPLDWRGEKPEAIVAWLLGLPKPCGIFTCTDRWATIVVRYIRLAGLRVPEDLALVGVDNDVVECELMAPPLSSVAVPWPELGMRAAKLVERVLSGESIDGQRLLTSPVTVMSRRSSEILAIDDELVAKAVRWIREHADQRLSVPMVAHSIGGGRQRLERRFRRALDRTVQEEIRRARVEAAKGLLQSTRAGMAEIARRSGFTNASLLSLAFKREVGIPPGVFRRRVRQALVSAGDE
jgi:LacI family transcriptional regulator